MALHDFFGLWALDPTSCDYGDRAPPRRGLYALEAEGDAIRARIQWLDAAGDTHATTFVMAPDGAHHPLPDGASLVCRLEGDVLVSEVHTGGVVTHAARRTLSPDGASMEVAQELGGDRMRATYRRVRTDVKQVILYRRDLNMRKGKIAAQVAHASMKVLLDRDVGGWDRLVIPLDDVMASWTRARFAKVVLSVPTDDDLVRAHELARAHGLPTALITDAGHTEFHGVPTRTAVAIGPAPIDAIDVITGPGGLIPATLA